MINLSVLVSIRIILEPCGSRANEQGRNDAATPLAPRPPLRGLPLMVTGKTEAPPAVGLDEALAPELWCFVCGFLPAASIAALGATNRRLREVVRSAPAWRGTEFVVASESAFDVVRDAWGGCVGELCLRGSWVDDAVVASCSDATFPFLVSLAITRSSGLGLVAFDHCRLRELTLRRLTCLRVVAVGCPSLVSLTVSADLSVLDSVLVESRTTSAGADSESEGEIEGENAGDCAVGQADRCAPSTLTRLVVRQDPALLQRPDSPRLERLPSLLVDASGLEVLAMPVPTWPTGPAGILRLLRASPRLRCLTLTGKADPGEALWVTTEVAEGRVPAQLRDHARSCKCHTDGTAWRAAMLVALVEQNFFLTALMERMECMASVVEIEMMGKIDGNPPGLNLGACRGQPGPIRGCRGVGLARASPPPLRGRLCLAPGAAPAPAAPLVPRGGLPVACLPLRPVGSARVGAGSGACSVSPVRGRHHSPPSRSLPVGAFDFFLLLLLVLACVVGGASSH